MRHTHENVKITIIVPIKREWNPIRQPHYNAVLPEKRNNQFISQLYKLTKYKLLSTVRWNSRFGHSNPIPSGIEL